MNIINAYDGQHLLGFSPTARMCVKGFFIGSIIWSIRPEEEDLSHSRNPANRFKIFRLAIEALYLLSYNIYGTSLIEAIDSTSITNAGLTVAGIYVSPKSNITMKIVTIFLKFVLLANIVVMLVKEGGWIPIVALTSYLFTTIVQDTNIVPYKVSNLCYAIAGGPLLSDICHFLVFSGKQQKILLLFVIADLAYICLW